MGVKSNEVGRIGMVRRVALLDRIHDGADTAEAQAMCWVADVECVFFGAKLLTEVSKNKAKLG